MEQHGVAIRRSRWPTVLIGVVAPFVSAAQAGVGAEVNDSPLCPTCRIELALVASLGGATDTEGLIDVASRFARNSAGRFYVTPTGVPGEVKVFDSRGKAEASIGRHGSGPGELLDPRRVFVGPGDSVHVLDWENRRYSVFSPDGRFGRSYTMQYHPPWSIIYLKNGESIQQIDSRGPDDIGYPVHVVRSNGDIRKSFGADPAIADPSDPSGLLRRMAWAGGGRVWTTRLDQYVLELWDTSGTLVDRLIRRPQWFKEWQGQVQGTTLGGLRVDAEGLLWSLVAMFEPATRTPPRTLTEVAANRRGRETIVEVLDTNGRRVVSSRRFPLSLSGFVDDLVSVRRERSDGAVVLDIYRLSLVRP